jgi:hypothetical protein
MNRDVWATIAATIAVVVVVILGFHALGGPRSQRLIQSDHRTLRALSRLSEQINTKWTSSVGVLPANLDGFPDSEKRNPVTNKPFVYHPKAGNAYELCATFATDSHDSQGQDSTDSWAHPKGDYCFQLDASQPAPPLPNSYDY